ncbi:MAG TPA: AsmA-like C-terminal region-containing protein [Microvirga sp.]|jgi:AsmA protein|nr:AsmA-like C-terminal region-containing protein [Microvirga sp.]
MPRRVLFLIALLSLALLGTGVAPWPLSSSGFATAVGQHLDAEYGLSLDVRGRSTIALLPEPRVKFENIRMASGDRSVVVDGGTLRGQLKVLPLLFGRVELQDITLAQSSVTVAGTPLDAFDGSRLAALFKDTRGPDASLPHADRVRLIDAAVRFADMASPISRANVTFDWPERSGALEVSGSFVWRGEPVQIERISVTPFLLATGRMSPVSVALEAPSARLALAGELQPGPEMRLTGYNTVAARSLPDFSRWSGLELPLANLLPNIAVEGDFNAHKQRISWPSVVVTVGPDRMEGALALRLDGERPVVTGTLAAERLNLQELVAPLAQAKTPSGLWSRDPVSLAPATGGELDLRISATSAQAGALKVADLAGSLLVRPGRIEASVGRATLNKGTVKGRLTLASVSGGGVDVRSQATFEGLDLAGFLADLRHPRWITGIAQGQFVLEGAGATAAEVVRQSQGRTQVTVRQGELIGIGLNDALRRVEKRPLSAFLDWKGGRTPFDQAQVSLAIVGGQGEIVDGALSAPHLRAGIQGRVSLVERAVTIKAQVDPITATPSPTPTIVFDVTGGWDDVAVIPDARAMIERSGAAKPLFGLERLGAPATARDASAVPLAQ